MVFVEKMPDVLRNNLYIFVPQGRNLFFIIQYNYKMYHRQRINFNKLKRYKTEAIETDLEKTFRQDTTAIVFQEEVKTINNYFQLMRNIFGKKQQPNHAKKAFPQKMSVQRERIIEQYKSERGKSTNNNQNVQMIQNRTMHINMQDSGLKVKNKMRMQRISKMFLKSRRNPYGEVMKGSPKSKHSILMSKLSTIQNSQYSPLGQIERSDNFQEFVPIGNIQNKNMHQKYQIFGLTNLNKKSLDKLQIKSIQKMNSISNRNQFVLGPKPKPKSKSRPSTSIRTIHHSKDNSMHKTKERKSFIEAIKRMSPGKASDSLFSPWDEHTHRKP